MHKLTLKLLICVLFIFVHYETFSQNAISTENALPGNPASEWDVSGAGDLSIQGFAAEISVNKGNPIDFKITTGAGIGFGIKIYRLGYYLGNGARLVADLGSSFVGISQAPCITDATTGETDCGNWISQAIWNVPSTAVSGVYIAKLWRNDNGGASHIIFVVRDDAAHSPILFKTSDATWQAYNDYGGNNLYGGTVAGYPQGHATKVSYNRPMINRQGVYPNTAIPGLTGLFNAEYAMIRWLERNGYDMSYSTCVDMASDPSPITTSIHKILLSVGHDEYWSGPERAKFEAAGNAGVSLAFFSGNEMYWKTRWENSIDGSGTAFRTLVCYKEGDGERGCGGKCDPLANVWTGLWRSGCNFPSADACNPENKLSGQISWAGSTNSLTVPSAYKNFRFWKNTSIAALTAGQSVTLPFGTLGHEWDPETYAYASSYPTQRITMSNTVVSGQVHKLSLYKRSSGAFIFGAGTVQWSWGLDAGHDRGNLPPSQDMQQATVNLFADMGAQPATLQPELFAANISTDITPPSANISTPSTGSNIVIHSATVISGSASDIGGAVGGVELSFDNGTTWKAATGTDTWTYTWTPSTAGTVTIKARAFDDTWNITAPGAEATITSTVIALPSAGICASSDIAAEFNSGTTDANTIISLDGNGSLILKPVENLDFEAATTPTGWSEGSWSGSNTPQYSGGIVSIDGSHLFSNTTYSPGNSLDFLASFSDDAFQNIGFSLDGNFNDPWVVIGRDASAANGTLYARTSNGDNTLLGTNLTGQFHRYKIKWNTNNFEFYVDGALVTTIFVTMSGGVVHCSDFNANGLDLLIDWIRISPYPTAGTYESKVFDAGANTSWSQLFWNALQPVSTSLSISVRTGNTSIPDGTWSAYTSIPNGGDINVISRYIQYQANLGNSDDAYTPELQDLVITCNFAFPVSLINLQGSAFNNNVKLEWSTASESNNKGFDIQRSVNGRDWNQIGFVPGAGNSSIMLHYEYLDKNPGTSKYYYRLRQVDNDGKFALSKIIVIDLAEKSGFGLEQNYPNPFTGHTMIAYTIPKSTNVKLIMYDLQGRVVKLIEQGLKSEGHYFIEIQTGNLGPGIYYYRLEAGEFSSTRKMIVQ